MSIKGLLEERGERYGCFKSNAVASQDLKRTLHCCRTQVLQAHHKEALELIILKISRIITGDPDYIDNWRDIAGYAELVASILEGNGIGKDS